MRKIFAVGVLGWLPLLALAANVAPLSDRFEALKRSTPALWSAAELRVVSQEDDRQAEGQVWGLIDLPYPALATRLQTPTAWCEVLILHLNVKYCRASGAPGSPILEVAVGRKFDQPLSQAQWLRFTGRWNASTQGLQLDLQAPHGPMGTHDYRIVLEAAPWDSRHSLTQLRYACGYGLWARWGLQAYLATWGGDKVGFSMLSSRPDLPGMPVRGIRGLVERNAMRYLLALQAWAASLRLPEEQQTEARLEAWFDATQQFAPQLYEVPRDDYLRMKRSELKRQKEVPEPPLISR
jgi:hypothetical protein